MAANFDVSTGSAKYGGDMTTAAQREANEDFTDGDGGENELVISGINLSDRKVRSSHHHLYDGYPASVR